jgi:vesicle coat complex subunit
LVRRLPPCRSHHIKGEYAERIDNADELLEAFIGNFKEENTQVQLQLLTATVKLFLKKPKNTQKLVQRALDLATQCVSPTLSSIARSVVTEANQGDR